MNDPTTPLVLSSLAPFLILMCLAGFAFLALAATAFWVWMIIDCAQNESSMGNDKIAWLLVIIFGHGIGALIYYFVRKAPRGKLR